MDISFFQDFLEEKSHINPAHSTFSLSTFQSLAYLFVLHIINGLIIYKKKKKERLRIKKSEDKKYRENVCSGRWIYIIIFYIDSHRYTLIFGIFS